MKLAFYREVGWFIIGGTRRHWFKNKVVANWIKTRLHRQCESIHQAFVFFFFFYVIKSLVVLAGDLRPFRKEGVKRYSTVLRIGFLAHAL